MYKDDTFWYHRFEWEASEGFFLGNFAESIINVDEYNV
jgi:hypothetical protein